VIVRPAATVNENGIGPVVPPTLSVAVTLKFSVPAEAGIPESNPVGLKLSPVPVRPVADHA
jgi:hypothetical protein